MDPAFPQLEVACDAARMREVFRANLKPAPGISVRISECAPFRFRCRQSTSRCVLQYTLRLEQESTGRQWDQWATGLIYADPAEAGRVWQSMTGTGPVHEIPEAWRSFEPVTFIPELEMVVEVFPYDRRLRQLAQVMHGGLLELEALLLARRGAAWRRGAAPTIEPTRYRTEMGAVLRYSIPAVEVGTGRVETLRCYVKVYRNERGKDTFERLKSWAREPLREYGLIRPIAYWSELNTLALEEAPGTSLQDLLKSDGDLLPAMRSTGRAAAAFNRDDHGITRHQSLADQLDQLERASILVQWACPEARNEIQAITNAAASGLTEVPAASIHGDLKPDHVFLDNGRVVFVDLDSVALADPVRDPAHFCSYVLGRVGLDGMSRPRARALAREFADAYFYEVPRDWRSRFPLRCAGALIEVACGIFRHQRPGWREGAVAAIEEAQRVLSGGL